MNSSFPNGRQVMQESLPRRWISGGMTVMLVRRGDRPQGAPPSNCAPPKSWNAVCDLAGQVGRDVGNRGNCAYTATICRFSAQHLPDRRANGASERDLLIRKRSFLFHLVRLTLHKEI